MEKGEVLEGLLEQAEVLGYKGQLLGFLWAGGEGEDQQRPRRGPGGGQGLRPGDAHAHLPSPLQLQCEEPG